MATSSSILCRRGKDRQAVLAVFLPAYGHGSTFAASARRPPPIPHCKEWDYYKVLRRVPAEEAA